MFAPAQSVVCEGRRVPTVLWKGMRLMGGLPGPLWCFRSGRLVQHQPLNTASVDTAALFVESEG